MGRLTPEGDRSALSAVTELARDSVRPPSPEHIERGLRTLRARLAASRARRHAGWRLSLGAAVILLLVIGLWGAPALRSRWAPAQPAVALDWIEGGTLLDGGYLSESGHAGIRLSFNEGSTFVLAPGTRGRLREVSSVGARFVRPAELTRMLTLPKAPSVSPSTRSRDARSDTSDVRRSDRLPSSSISRATVSTCSARREVGTTSAPASANPWAMARPIPEVPPTTLQEGLPP